jgi:hypothetical protein
VSVREEMEFWDMCPHRINVAKVIGRNNEGRPQVEPGSQRTYRCLIDSSVSLARGLQGEDETVGINAHVLATPMENEASDVQWEIKTEESVVFLIPQGQEKRPIKSVEKFYDETGGLHNMVIHFS